MRVEVGGWLAVVAQPDDDLGERLGELVEQAGADLAEPLVALVGGEVDDPQHAAVVLPEVEHAVDERARRVS